MITKDDIVYISGPMTGIADANRPAFRAAEKRLKEAYGCTVLNPADQPDGLPYCRYMITALQMLNKASAVVMLPGFPASAGATFEYQCARYDRKRTFFLRANSVELIDIITMAEARREAAKRREA